MTCREAAKKLGVSIDWIHKLIWNGKLKATKTLSGWNVDETDVTRRDMTVRHKPRRKRVAA